MTSSAQDFDMPIVQHAAHRNFEQRLACGVRIFENPRSALLAFKNDNALPRNHIPRCYFFTLSALACALLLGPIAHAQQPYPSKAIRLIVPFPPGGGNDTVARIVGQRLNERLGQAVVIDNRGGAGGNIGMELAAKALGDGYALVLGSLTTLVINPNVYKELTFSTTKDFAPITQLASSSLVLVIHPTVPAKSVKQLIALARSQPGRLNYGAGSTAGHLAGELFKMTAGLNIVHIPYKGNAQALTDLMSGQVALLFGGCARCSTPR